MNRSARPEGLSLARRVGIIRVEARALRTFESFTGLAADGVTRVGVITELDRLVPLAAVRGNAFYADALSRRIKAIVALDEKGEVIWQSAPVPLPDE